MTPEKMQQSTCTQPFIQQIETMGHTDTHRYARNIFRDAVIRTARNCDTQISKCAIHTDCDPGANPDWGTLQHHTSTGTPPQDTCNWDGGRRHTDLLLFGQISIKLKARHDETVGPFGVS